MRKEQRLGRDRAAWRVAITGLGAAWLLVLAALPIAASPASPDPSSRESPLAMSGKDQEVPDHADVDTPAAGATIVRYDRILDRHTGVHRSSSGGLRMLHAVLRL